ncbi:hypothetical protein [Pedobacter agri]|uniref:hypothetical protein n=1 Tax=Pedobacter agri TaxID=454586 RepID=UPI00278688FC|nr:hypothetical protein [Pedobacter agri]MDQ1143079.1 hypothetical protein [Pedobacter agri]
MKTINTILFSLATVVALMACNNDKKASQDITSKTSSKVEVNKVDIDKAMKGVPTFSSPEIQKEAQEWFSYFSEGMKEAQQKAKLADGDQAKMKQIGKEMGEKFAPWKEKIVALKAKMTAEDKVKFEQYGNKIAQDIVAQAHQ